MQVRSFLLSPRVVNYQSIILKAPFSCCCLFGWQLFLSFASNAFVEVQQCTVGHIRRLSKGFRAQEWHRLIVWLSSISCVTWTKVVNGLWWSVKANPQHAMLPLYTPDTFSCYIHTPIEPLSQLGQLLYSVSQVRPSDKLRLSPTPCPAFKQYGYAYKPTIT